jgi:hypothetical protein
VTIRVASDFGADDGERGGGVVKSEDRVGVGGCTDVTAGIVGILMVPGDFDVLLEMPLRVGVRENEEGTMFDGGV